MTDHKLSLEEGIKIQQSQLAEWQMVLIPSVFATLKAYAEEKNDTITDDDGFKVTRGNSLDVFVCNHARILKKQSEIKEPTPLNVEVLGLEIDFEIVIEDGSLDVGALTLERQGRKYIFDIIESRYSHENNHTTVYCKLEVDTDTFPMDEENPYTMIDADFYQHSDLKTEVFLGEVIDEEPTSITLFVKQGGCTVAIDVAREY